MFGLCLVNRLGVRNSLRLSRRHDCISSMREGSGTKHGRLSQCRHNRAFCFDCVAFELLPSNWMVRSFSLQVAVFYGRARGISRVQECLQLAHTHETGQAPRFVLSRSVCASVSFFFFFFSCPPGPTTCRCAAVACGLRYIHSPDGGTA